MHSDDDRRRVGRGAADEGKPREPARSEHRFVEDHHINRDATEEADEVRQVRGRSRRLYPRLALEQAPERGSDAFVARDNEHRDRGIVCNRLHGH
jgi:hypothetical protein